MKEIKKYHFDYLIEKKKNKKIKNVLIDDTKHKNWLIYFTRYNREKSIETLSAYYHRLVGDTEEHERKIIWWLLIIFWIKH